MNWLARVWFKIWVEQAQPKSRAIETDGLVTEQRTSETDNPLASLQPHYVEGGIFQLALSNEWTPFKVNDEGSTVFHHDRLDIDFVFSFYATELQKHRLEELAGSWLVERATEIDGFKRELGLYPVSAQDDVFQQSWGYQASVIRLYSNGDILRYFGFLSPAGIMSLSFEGQTSVEHEYDIEVQKALNSIRFSDEFWGEQEFPEGSKLQ